MKTPVTTAQTKLTGLVGYPVSHSLSPAIHGAAIRAAGLDAVYLAFAIHPDQVMGALEGLLCVGVLGLNATIPHKFACLAVADEATPEARFVGCANTLYRDGDRVIAHNTDVIALHGELSALGVHEGDRVDIVGAGGAARSVAVAAGQLGAAVRCWARDSQKADAIVALAQTAGGRAGAHHDRPRVVVNATPLGRHGESLPEPYMGLGEGQVAYDLNYGQPSPFLRTAQVNGALCRDGLGMLVGQGEAAFSCWFGIAPPAGVMEGAITFN